MQTVWHLLSPVGVRKQRAAARPKTGAGERVVGFISNRKPNASALLQDLMARLKTRGFETRFYEKRNAATPGGEALLKRVSKECSLVIVASGD